MKVTIISLFKAHAYRKSIAIARRVFGKVKFFQFVAAVRHSNGFIDT